MFVYVYSLYYFVPVMVATASFVLILICCFTSPRFRAARGCVQTPPILIFELR